MQIVDTPGLFDVDDDESGDDVKLREILKCVVLTLPGPHVFLLVYSGAARFTREDAHVNEQIAQLFSHDITRYVIIVFTNVSDQEELDALLKEPPHYLQTLLDRCEHRVMAIDNGKRERPRECQAQAEAIIQAAFRLRDHNWQGTQARLNGQGYSPPRAQSDDQGQSPVQPTLAGNHHPNPFSSSQDSEAPTDYYTNSLVHRCLQIVQSSETHKTLEEIKQGVLRGDEACTRRLADDGQVQAAVKKSWWPCAIL